ncbi:DNA-processing protein DprA [Streptomyces mexicanus]|uniref:DNA-processing protein DprA n=1 Tax=Streptomyces mexicanus TaxID=178566 RepID=UPI00367F2C1F
MTASDGTGRATPDGTGVTGSDGSGAGTGAPGGSGTTAPDGVRTSAPGGARPSVPVRAHTSVRGGAGTSAPDGAGAATSDSAGVRAPDGADSERLARVFLSRVVEPGDETGGRWVRELGAVAVARRLREGTPRLPGVSDKRWAGLRARAERADPRRDLAAAREAGVRFLCPGDTEWPAQLDDLGDARPTGLWVRGRPHLRMWALRSVAVVGARACTEYGAHMAATLAAGLAERGWVVVSGGAYGVDGAAHRGTLAGGGATVAVLACGVDRPYPRGHTELINRVAQQGLVIGELPPGDHPTPSRFLVRNRVIAALTRGTVVVEAAHRSGSLVTARAAQRLGRHIMGVPGPATSALSAGVHELLRGGAVLVTDAAEIVELVGDMGELAPDRRGPVLPRDLLDADARQVLAALPGHGTAAPDDIARDARTTVDDVIARLYELRSLGYVERHGEGWRLTRQAVISARADRTGC